MAVASTTTYFLLRVLRNQIERQVYDHKGSQVTAITEEVRIQPICPRIMKLKALIHTLIEVSLSLLLHASFWCQFFQ